MLNHRGASDYGMIVVFGPRKAKSIDNKRRKSAQSELFPAVFACH